MPGNGKQLNAKLLAFLWNMAELSPSIVLCSKKKTIVVLISYMYFMSELVNLSSTAVGHVGRHFQALIGSYNVTETVTRRNYTRLPVLIMGSGEPRTLASQRALLVKRGHLTSHDQH